MCEYVTYELTHVCRSLEKAESSCSTTQGLLNRKTKQLEEQIENLKRISTQELQSCIENYKMEQTKTDRQHEEEQKRSVGIGDYPGQN